jgi:hypothetical protein
MHGAEGKDDEELDREEGGQEEHDEARAVGLECSGRYIDMRENRSRAPVTGGDRGRVRFVGATRTPVVAGRGAQRAENVRRSMVGDGDRVSLRWGGNLVGW